MPMQAARLVRFCTQTYINKQSILTGIQLYIITTACLFRMDAHRSADHSDGYTETLLLEFYAMLFDPVHDFSRIPFELVEFCV